MLPRRRPGWDDVLAAAWVSPEPPAACPSGTRAGARQGAAQSRKKQAETVLPVGMRPLYFPFTHHTWDQPGGHQQSPLTRRTRLSTSPCSSLVLNPIPGIPHAGHPSASNLLLRPGQSGGCSPALLLGGWDRESPQGNLGKEKTHLASSRKRQHRQDCRSQPGKGSGPSPVLPSGRCISFRCRGSHFFFPYHISPVPVDYFSVGSSE